MGIVASMRAKLMQSDEEGREDFDFWIEQAELYFTQSLELKEEVFHKHPITADTHFNLAKFYIQSKKTSEAKEHLEKCCRIYLSFINFHKKVKGSHNLNRLSRDLDEQESSQP